MLALRAADGEKTDSTIVTVNQHPPVANFTSEPAGSATVKFTDTSLYSPNTWSWNFGDNSSPSNEQNPTHKFPKKSTTYTVRLTVTNSAGSSKKVTSIKTPG
jgi:PKD repeat protein